MSTEREILISIKADIEDLKKGMGQSEKAINQNKKAAQGAAKDMSVLTDQLKVLNVNFGGVGVNVGQLAKQLNSSMGVLKRATMSVRAFGLALAATGIGLIVAALAALISAFSSTQVGADKLNDVMHRIKAAIGAVWGLVQEFAVDKFTKIFEDPRQAVIDLWEAIKTNIVNRMKGLIDSYGALGKAVKAAFRLDLDGIKQAGKEFINAQIQMLTGVENFTEKAKNLYEKVNEEVTRGVNIGKQIAAIEKQIMQARINSEIPLRRANREYQELNTIASDTSKTEEERAEALEGMRNLAAKIRDINAGIVSLEVKKLKLQQSINDTSDEERLTLQQKIGELEDINANYAAQEKLINRIGNGLKEVKETVEEINPHLAMAQSYFDNTRTSAEKLEKQMQEVKMLIDSGFFEQLGIDGEDVLNRLSNQMSEVVKSSTILADLIVNDLVNGLAMAIEQGQNFGDTMKRVLKSMIIQLIAAIVKAKLLFALTGGASAGGGVGASILGLFGGGRPSAPAFAKGGAVTGPTLAIVGDNPSGKEFITPSESIGQLAGAITRSMGGGSMGGNMGIFGRFDISGDNLRVILNRNNVKATR